MNVIEYAHAMPIRYSANSGHIIICVGRASVPAYFISTWMPPFDQRSRCRYRPFTVSGIRIQLSACGSYTTRQSRHCSFQLMSMSSVSMSELQ